MGLKTWMFLLNTLLHSVQFFSLTIVIVNAFDLIVLRRISRTRVFAINIRIWCGFGNIFVVTGFAVRTSINSRAFLSVALVTDSFQDFNVDAYESKLLVYRNLQRTLSHPNTYSQRCLMDWTVWAEVSFQVEHLLQIPSSHSLNVTLLGLVF